MASDGDVLPVEVHMLAIAVMSYSWPVLVVALWWGMRWAGRPAAMAPTLFAAMVCPAGLMIAAAEREADPAVASATLGMLLAWAALFDFIQSDDGGPDSADEDDRGGGWGRGGRRPPPVPPRGGLTRDPEWWPAFEQAFRAHVDSEGDRRGVTVVNRRSP
jgi:hypothetical protein